MHESIGKQTRSSLIEFDVIFILELLWLVLAPYAKTMKLPRSRRSNSVEFANNQIIS